MGWKLYWPALAGAVFVTLPWLVLAAVFPGDTGVSNANAEWLGLAALLLPSGAHFALAFAFVWWRWRMAVVYCCAICLMLLAVLWRLLGPHDDSSSGLAAAFCVAFIGPMIAWAVARGARFVFISGREA